MARKLTDVVQVNLRLREKLRRQLEKAAARRQVSLNYEMTSRIQETFDRKSLFDLDTVAGDMSIAWGRYSALFHTLNLQGDLMRAAETLVQQLEKTERDDKAITKAVDKVKQVIKVIGLAGAKMPREMHTV
jgi:hypothetical protein